MQKLSFDYKEPYKFEDRIYQSKIWSKFIFRHKWWQFLNLRYRSHACTLISYCCNELN